MKVGPPEAIGVPAGSPLTYRNPYNYRTWSYTYEGLAAKQSGTIAFAQQRQPGQVQPGKVPAPAWRAHPPGTKVKILGPGPDGAATAIAIPNKTT